MKIAIIGTGNVGAALAKGWAKAGHEILLAVRDANNFKGKELLAQKNISAQPIATAIKTAEVLLIATPPDVVNELAKAIVDVKDKVIIDATNSIRSSPAGYANASEALRALTNCADIVKCFNSTGFENMENPIYDDKGIDMFVAGDSVKGKEIAKQLAKDLGFEECYDFGGNDKIALLEQFALAWINLAIMQKQGRGIAFKVIKR